ncbi:helix-turn-helix domain-containing protein [Bradyrhizobium cenepequi]
MEIRPIRTDKDHRAALAEIDARWGAPEGTDEGDTLDLLLALVEIYEAKRWPTGIDEGFDPVDVLSYAVDELGHTQAELAELLGSRSRASEILSRQRALTVEMIHKISEAWKIPADLLVRPYKIKRAVSARASVWTLAGRCSVVEPLVPLKAIRALEQPARHGR